MSPQRSVPVAIPATMAHRQFGDLLRRAFSGKEHFIVEKDGLPVVAILSVAEYEELMRERERQQERLERFRAAARALGESYDQQGLSEDDVLALLEQTREQVFREHYGDTATE